jgi:hypothetical protein
MSRISGYGNSVQQTNSPEVSQPTAGLDSGVPPAAPTDPAVDVPSNQTDFASDAKRMLDLGAGIMKKSLQDAVDTVEHSKTIAETVIDGATEAVQDKIRKGVVDIVQNAQQAKQFVDETGLLLETVVDGATEQVKETLRKGATDAVEFARGNE